MIRSTWNNRLSRLTSEMGSLGRELSKIQTRASTGLEFSRPSDEPAKVTRVHTLSSRLADQQTWKENAQHASSWQTLADTALGHALDITTRAYELATQMASETYNDTDRTQSAIEVQGLFQDLITTANSEMEGRFLFAGAATSTQPFDAAGTYLGSASSASTLVGQGLDVKVGFVGSDMFQNGVDVLATVRDLATALAANDVLNVQAAVGDLANAVETLTRARILVGVEQASAIDAEELAGNLETFLSSDLNAEIEADPVSTYIRLSETQSSYEAALQVLSSTRGMSLFEAM